MAGTGIDVKAMRRVRVDKLRTGVHRCQMIRLTNGKRIDEEFPDSVEPCGPGTVGRLWKPALLILTISVVGWALLAWVAFDMSHPVAKLTMPASSRWKPGNLFAILAMWAVMMAAMMLPSALSTVMAFARIGNESERAFRLLGFVGGYVLVWLAFSVVATAAQWALQAANWVDPMIISTSKWLSGSLLVISGLYQFSPLKRVCLGNCRTPLGFLLGEWRAGLGGAAIMGLRHGLFCLGCCWALMALLFVGGVMNLAWIAALSIAVAIEKLAPHGERVALVLGLGLLGAGVLRLAT
jgi:predicted metal-binding membrane protein